LASDKQYRVVHGIIQFEPREGEAGGKPIRNIRIRQTGFGQQSVNVSLTVWGSSHGHVPLAEGDVITAEGSYEARKVTKDDGSQVTYHNLSVSKIKNFGAADSGTRTETVNDVADETADDDDVPF
jgi:hypothetical protein